MLENRNFRLADIVTLGNGFCGSLSLFSSARYLISSNPTDLWSVFSNSPLQKRLAIDGIWRIGMRWLIHWLE